MVNQIEVKAYFRISDRQGQDAVTLLRQKLHQMSGGKVIELKPSKDQVKVTMNCGLGADLERWVSAVKEQTQELGFIPAEEKMEYKIKFDQTPSE